MGRIAMAAAVAGLYATYFHRSDHPITGGYRSPYGYRDRDDSPHMQKLQKEMNELSQIGRLEKKNPKMANIMKSQRAKRKATEDFVKRFSKKR